MELNFQKNKHDIKLILITLRKERIMLNKIKKILYALFLTIITLVILFSIIFGITFIVKFKIIQIITFVIFGILIFFSSYIVANEKFNK